MVKEIRPIDNEYRRRSCFRGRNATLFAMAQDLSEEFGADLAVVAFSPDGEPRAFGSPTADSVFRAYLPDAAPPPPSPSRPHSAGAETAGDAAAWARVAAATEKVRAAQASAGKRNWGEVGVEALGEEELPVFVRALEMLRDEIQGRIDAKASACLQLPWKEKQQR